MPSSDEISSALEHIIDRFGRLVHVIGRRRGLADADLDELTQDVRVRLWRSLADHEKIQSVHTSYVYRAATSAALDMIRRRRSGAAISIESMPTPAGNEGAGEPVVSGTRAPERPDSELEQRELGERIDRAINRLPEPRDVVVRLHLSGYDRFEIAALLGWTEPKVRNLIYRGLADLRAVLLHEGIGPRSVV